VLHGSDATFYYGMDSNQSKLVNGILLGAIGAVILVTLLTIIGDLYAPLKNLLKDAHYHHWVGKGVWAAVLFVIIVFGYILGAKNSNKKITDKLLKILSCVAIISAVALILFFVYEFSHT